MANRYNILLLICLFTPLPVPADNFFIDLIENTETTDEDLQKALKQINEYTVTKPEELISLAPFHLPRKQKETLKQPFCLTCHLSKPHRKNQRKRSFLNRHIRDISCETCHLQARDINLEYRWLAYDYPNTGEMIDSSISIHMQADKTKTSILPRPGVRIAPFYRGKPALLLHDDPYSVDIRQQWENASSEEQARLKVKLHASIIHNGHDCKKCHSENQNMLDLKLLGANEKQIHSIIGNKIAQFFTRYKNDTDSLQLSDLLR